MNDVLVSRCWCVSVRRWDGWNPPRDYQRPRMMVTFLVFFFFVWRVAFGFVRVVPPAKGQLSQWSISSEIPSLYCGAVFFVFVVNSMTSFWFVFCTHALKRERESERSPTRMPQVWRVCLCLVVCGWGERVSEFSVVEEYEWIPCVL